MEIPSTFDLSFLTWFQEKTESAWLNYQSYTFEQFLATGVGGMDWQQGTHWEKGLTEEEIMQCEQRWSISFPPDYKLFLRILHCVDRPGKGARYSEHNEMIPYYKPSFPNWLSQAEYTQEALRRPLDGLLFDIKNNNFWLESWGIKPPIFTLQEELIIDKISKAPKLIPLLGHRYLLSEPQDFGNPVLSIHQSDIIIYAPNLYVFLLWEFRDLLGLQQNQPHSQTESNLRFSMYNSFWYGVFSGK